VAQVVGPEFKPQYHTHTKTTEHFCELMYFLDFICKDVFRFMSKTTVKHYSFGNFIYNKSLLFSLINQGFPVLLL
jgi:hypothetical protein